MATRYIKQGDTLSLECVRRDSAGAAVNLTGLTISSKVRLDSFVATLTVNVTSTAGGEFTLSALPAATQTWPVGAAKCDVQFVDGGGVTVSSQTFDLVVLEDVTY